MSITYGIDMGALAKNLAIDHVTLEAELAKWTHAVERDAKRYVRVRTGNLKQHIFTENAPGYHAVIADTKPPPFKKPEQSGADYAAVVETNVEPYMEPAVDNNSDFGNIKILKARITYKV